jgi:hypothetical protein
MTTRLTILLRMLGVALLTMLLLATPAMAQDDDDDDDDHQHATGTVTSSDDDDEDGQATGTAAAGSDDDRFGTFIHAGSCEALGDVVEDIGELDDDDDRDDDDDDWQKVGGDEPRPDVLYSEDEDIGQAIDELASGEFVVTVHEGESAETAAIA